MAITSNLYPPLVNDSMPSFIRTKKCKIYFSLSRYNSITDIKNVQISLINQKTNFSAFKTDMYPSGIKIATILFDSNIQDDYNYYIEIPVSDLEEEEFGLNEFYKVQLRFTSNMASNPPSNAGRELATWLYNNKQYFSEWSKVCLIKGIEQPIITIRGFDNIEANQEIILTSSIIDIVGELNYNKAENEYLKSYNIKIYQFDDSALIVDSGQIYTNPYNPNEFNYKIAYNLLDGVKYKLKFTYTTNNSYTESINYDFTIIQYGINKLNADIIATPDEENGRIKIDIIAKDTDNFIGNLTIRRTSSESNFHRWQDVKTINYSTGQSLNYTWYDITIESGIWYKYCAQRRNSHGDRGAIIQTDNPIMCLLEDIFLTKNDCQLKIKFNPFLNEFKYNVSESQQTTIGSQYPYVRRNGNNYYRSFPIGGLISSFVDTTNWYDPHFYEGEFHDDENEIKTFTSKNNIYGEAQNLYNQYNNNYNITEYNDYIYEREFRKKVYDFLYKNDIKLFRSTTEGNILIKLMNIDFQPIESLGRRLYSFTATAIEIDEANIINYDKYKIQTVGEYQKQIAYEHKVFGQIQKNFIAAQNLMNVISKKYKNIANKGFINEVNGLTWLRIEITSEPYVIIQNNGELIKGTESEISSAKFLTVGHIIVINGQEFIIPSSLQRKVTSTLIQNQKPIITKIGYFELKQSNTFVTNLYFKENTEATIDYIANLKEIEDTSNLANQLYYSYLPGQLYGTFKPQDSLLRKIYNKYLLNYKKYYQKLLEITDIRIQATPNAVVYIKDSKDDDFNRHVLSNGFLQLKDDDANIEGIYFCGLHFTECKNPLQLTKVNGLTEFTEQIGIYNSFEQIIESNNLVNGGIYQIKTYGLKKVSTFENNRVLIIDEDFITTTQLNEDNVYTLLLDEINDDTTIQFIYYYGCWYSAKNIKEKISLIKGDIRHLRANEYILTNERYNMLSDITNPIQNGVYQIALHAIDNDVANYDYINDLLTVNSDHIIQKTDKNYMLLLYKIFQSSQNRYIYYQNHWYPFTEKGDILCPVDGLIDYNCEIVKGVY